MTGAPDYQAEYAQANNAERVQRSRIGCVVAVISFPLGSSLDLFLYPEHLVELSILRYLALIPLGLVWWVHRLEGFRRHIRVTNFIMPTIVAISMCGMIAITDGFDGPYYAALNLLILGVSLLLPFDFRDAVVMVAITLMGFTLAGALHGLAAEDWRLAFNNYYFIVATGLIACTAAFFAERARRREFGLLYELDQRNHELDERNHELAELDRMKSHFFANVSHELRTPLTLILSPVEDMLRNPNLPERVRSQLIFVRDNSYRLLNLVNDLLDVMKLEEGMMRLDNKPVALKSLVSNIVGGMQHFAKQRQVELKVVALADADVEVLGDRRAIEKIAINLINNAVKFTPAGGQVEVILDHAGEFGCLRVDDTGPGVEESQAQYIFDRFRQVDGSSTRKHQGTGLGLALVKELVELMGGAVRLDSKSGQGASFCVNLPLNQGERDMMSALEDGLGENTDVATDVHGRARLAAPMARDTNQVDEATESGDDDRPRLVIIEDETDIREYLREMLSDEFEVFTAANGKAGYDLVLKARPDLVITDLMLPEMDGLAICKALREDPAMRNLKIMLLTARTDEKSKLTALDHGADDFLTKPFSTTEIKKRLANLWLTSKLQRSLHQQNEELASALDSLKTTQGKLIQSEKLNALGRLSAGLLHEVNNPLNYAYGTFQLLEREPELKSNERLSEMMADIKDGMQRISAIVRDLKTFAYPEAADLKQQFHLKAAINSVERLAAQTLRGVELDIQVCEPDLVVGSQSHIVQVLINLIENACHAMQSTGRAPRLEIHAQRQNDRINLCVKDNGTGIPADILERVFDPFFTTKEVGAGLGMGLSTCYTIIENHGGHLQVDSDSTSYTRFCFDLATPEFEGNKELIKETESE